MKSATFTPALGHAALTPLYDAAVRLLTRERRWRDKLIEQMSPHAGQSILDVGCGTGSLAVLIKQRAPGTRVVGLDPDPAVLASAADKAERAGVKIGWRRGFASDAGAFAGEFDKAVSTLVFHQVPPDEKEAGIEAMLDAVRPGGELHIADYCRQPDWTARQLFRVVQLLDGKANTQANLDGAVENALSRLGGSRVSPEHVIRTPTGAISLFRLRKDTSLWPEHVTVLGLFSAAVSLTGDQVLTGWARAAVDSSGVISVVRGLNIVSVDNSGVAFGVAGSWAPWVLILIGLLLAGLLFRWLTRTHSTVHAVGLGLAIGGAVGNIADRLLLGAVRDYIDLYWNGYYSPSFNLADVAIVTGLALVALLPDESTGATRGRPEL